MEQSTTTKMIFASTVVLGGLSILSGVGLLSGLRQVDGLSTTILESCCSSLSLRVGRTLSRLGWHL